MDDFFSQLRLILIASTGVIVVLSIVSVIVFLIKRLLNYDLSDQEGWRDYRNPFIGIILLIIGFFTIVLIVYILLGLLG